MLDVFNTSNPQEADVQYFYEDGVWTKPRGASHVYMMLIGGGGNGNGSTTGGASGAVTIWFGNANNIPDNLVIHPSNGNADNTTVSYRGSSLVTLLTANAATTITAGTASTATPFTTSGFFQSVAGQAGQTGVVTASTNTFLTGGGATAGTHTANYGYTKSNVGNGYIITQPVIVSLGAGGTVTNRTGGIGSGGNAGSTPVGSGGSGLVIIGSW